MKNWILSAFIFLVACTAAHEIRQLPPEQQLPHEQPDTATYMLLDCDAGDKTVLLGITLTYPSGKKVTIDSEHTYGFGLNGANDAAKYASSATKQRTVHMDCPK